MLKTLRFPLTFFGLVFLLSIPLFTLPSAGGGVYLSPDETENAAAARQLAEKGTVRIPWENGPAPWLHPRSVVFQAGSLVPVSFLGLPFVLAGLYRVGGEEAMVLLTPLLVAFSAFPLLLLAKRWGRVAQATAVVVWMTFPSVVLYANRGLFSDLPVVCLMIWSAWLVSEGPHRLRLAASGLLAGLAFVIRPPELLWIAPWLALWAWPWFASLRPRDRLKAAVVFAVPFCAVSLLGAMAGHATYGAWFVTGYNLRDPLPPAVPSAAPTVPATQFTALPFGFHPRNVLHNVKKYLFGLQLPWMLASLAAAAFAWRVKEARKWIIAGAATLGVLALVYGQGIYQDNIRPNAVSTGNSFLRYMIPFALFAALAAAWLAQHLMDRLDARWKKGLVLLTVAAFAVRGVAIAYVYDDEGILKNRIELERYATIRGATAAYLPSGTVIFSERSDKIFFPVFMAVSPMPPKDAIRDSMDATGRPTAVFIRPPSDSEREAWNQAGLDLEFVFGSGNENMYRLTRLP